MPSEQPDHVGWRGKGPIERRLHRHGDSIRFGRNAREVSGRSRERVEVHSARR